MATRKAKKDTLEKRVDQFKTKLRNLHDDALHVSDDLVDETIATGMKWQKLMAKTFQGGTEMFARQQDMVFDTLEEVKDQYAYGTKRFMKLVGLKPLKTKKTTTARKTPKAKTTRKATTKRKVQSNVASAKSDYVKDNLSLIEGIGPKFESLLNKAGINTYKQLASAEIKDIKKILVTAGPLFKSLDPTPWIAQAKLAMQGKLNK